MPGPDDVVLGNDPGRINIYYMVVVMEDGSTKCFKGKPHPETVL